MLASEQDVDAPHPLLDALVDAERLTEELFDGRRLREIVTGLLAAARARGHHALLGASRAGDRLVGAMLIEDSTMQPWRPGDDSVLIIDGVVVSDFGVRTKAEQLRALGVQDAHAVVVRVLLAEMVDREPGALASFDELLA